MMRNVPDRDEVLKPYRPILHAYSSWLSAHSPQHESRWTSELKGSNYEAAIAEAWCWHVVSPQTQTIEIHETPGQGGLDFVCTPQGDHQSQFYIEVAALRADATSERTQLPYSVNEWSGGFPGDLADKFKSKRRNKHEQILKAKIDDPTIVAFATLHPTAAFVHFGRTEAERLLIPPTQRCVPILPKDLESLGSWEEPLFDNTLFFKRGPRPKTYMPTCPEISAVMLCAIPWREVDNNRKCVYLILNPTALHPLDSAWLSHFDCCKLQHDWKDVDPCRWHVEWTNNWDL